MKTVLEQLMEVNKKLAEIEKVVMGASTDEEIEAKVKSLFPTDEVECDGHCGCGCDEPPVETEDEGPEFDSAGFSEADRIVTPQQANTIVFTKEELIDFAFKLMDRTVDACKEAVDSAFGGIDIEDLTTIELGYDNRITVEVNERSIINEIQSEIINTIDLDTDSIEIEVDNVLTDMLDEKNS
jgi:hypothetical protein